MSRWGEIQDEEEREREKKKKKDALRRIHILSHPLINVHQTAIRRRAMRKGESLFGNIFLSFSLSLYSSWLHTGQMREGEREKARATRFASYTLSIYLLKRLLPSSSQLTDWLADWLAGWDQKLNRAMRKWLPTRFMRYARVSVVCVLCVCVNMSREGERECEQVHVMFQFCALKSLVRKSAAHR